MSDYTRVIIDYRSPEQRDMLIAQLSGIGFEGFEEAQKFLEAYIPEAEFSEALLKNITDQHNLAYSISVVKQQNWNRLWELGFEPVIIDHFCAIRAEFHAAVPYVQHDMIITPKMSFGTGHHPTTYMMIAAMRQMEWKGKSVFDFGTGTGLLAILAEKLGATQITAIDNDDRSIENALENLQVNLCKKIDLYKADSLPSGQCFDVILANINKNSILAHLHSIAGKLKPHGIFLVSGLLVEDVKEIMEAAVRLALKQTGLQEKEQLDLYTACSNRRDLLVVSGDYFILLYTQPYT